MDENLDVESTTPGEFFGQSKIGSIHRSVLLSPHKSKILSNEKKEAISAKQRINHRMQIDKIKRILLVMKTKYEFFQENLGLTLTEMHDRSSSKYQPFLSKLQTQQNLKNTLEEAKNNLMLIRDKLDQ